jgi:aryl-alcohol dehydrogenase-like predicted oxidoreductase
MKYVQLPGTDLNVSAVCMGTGEIGSKVKREESFQLFDIMFEHGGNFIDTAKVYGDWVPDIPRSSSELTVGQWIRSRGVRDQIVVATKGCITADGHKEDENCRPETIMRHIEWSLNTLQVDCIDLWYIHKDDNRTPIDEIMDCLDSQVKAGKIKYYGASNMFVGRLKQATAYAEKKGISNFAIDQALWNAAVLAKFPYDSLDTTFMNTARYNFHKKHKMAFAAFQSTAFGLFHRYQKGTIEQMNRGFRSFYLDDLSSARYERMNEIMQRKNLTLSEVVLGYIYEHPDFNCIPIVGSHKADQVLENYKSGDARLTQEDIAYIEGEEKFGWE